MTKISIKKRQVTGSYQIHSDKELVIHQRFTEITESLKCDLNIKCSLVNAIGVGRSFDA